MNLIRRLPLSAFLTLVVFGSGAVLSVIAQLALSHVMAPGPYGDFALLYAAGMILSGMAALGYDLAALRFMAASAPSSLAPIQRVFFHSALRKAAWGAVVLAVLAPVVAVFAGFLPDSLALALVVLIPAWTFLRIIASVLRTESRSASSIAIDRVARDGALFVFAAALLAIGARAGDHWPALVLTGITVLSCMTGALLLRSMFRRPDLVASPEEEALWSRTARRLLSINGLELIAGRLDLFLLALVIDKAAVGQMNIVIVVSTIALLPGVFTGFILMPRIAAATAEGRHEAIRRELAVCNCLNIVSAVLVSATVLIVVSVFHSQPMLNAVASVPLDVLVWMFASRIVISTTMVRAARLQMTGQETVIIWAHMAAITLKVALYLLWPNMAGLQPAVLICFASAFLFVLVIYLGPRFRGGAPFLSRVE